MSYIIGYAASIGEENILDALKFAVSNGFKAVEINMNMTCFFPEKYSIEEIDIIKDFKLKNNMELTIHAPEDIPLLQLHENVRKEGINRLKEIIEFGKQIDASRITIHIGSTPYFTLVDGQCYLDDIYYYEYKSILKNTLRDLNNYCENRIKLCVENSGRFPKILIQEVLDDILINDNLFLTWDIGHSYKNLYNEISFFENNIESVKTCHLHDVNDKGDHKVIGEGNLDFLEHMNKIGTDDKVYIIEVRPRENAVKSFKNLKKILEI